MQPVEVGVAVRRPFEAIEAADRLSRALRGAYLLSQGESWRVAGGPSSSNRFKPSPLYSVRQGQKHVEWAYTPHVETGQTSLPDECPSRTRLVLRLLSRSPHPDTPRDILAKALSLYAAAGDAPLPHDRFLGMWQALEALSLADGGDTSRIARNIGNLWRNGAETVYYQLVALAPLRNKLVHVGEYNPHRQSATYLLNKIVQDAIVQFAQLSERLPTNEHYREVMSMMMFPKEKLETRAAAMKTVRWIRGLV